MVMKLATQCTGTAGLTCLACTVLELIDCTPSCSMLTVGDLPALGTGSWILTYASSLLCMLHMQHLSLQHTEHGWSLDEVEDGSTSVRWLLLCAVMLNALSP